MNNLENVKWHGSRMLKKPKKDLLITTQLDCITSTTTLYLVNIVFVKCWSNSYCLFHALIFINNRFCMHSPNPLTPFIKGEGQGAGREDETFCFCKEVGGWEIFKVSIAFLSSENNIFWLKNWCYTVLYKKQIILAASSTLIFSLKYINFIIKEINFSYLSIQRKNVCFSIRFSYISVK